MTNKTYDILKWVVMIVLPACSALYAALSSIWALPLSTEVTGTISAIATFLGTVLCISSANYNKTQDK